MPAHLFAYQLAYGVIPRLGWSGVEDAVICHQCDFAGCTNPAHMRLGTQATNRAEYFARRENPANPLADVRGAAGRTRSIAAAIRTGSANHEDAVSIERRILMPKPRAFPSPSGNDKCRNDKPDGTISLTVFPAVSISSFGCRESVGRRARCEAHLSTLSRVALAGFGNAGRTRPAGA